MDKIAAVKVKVKVEETLQRAKERLSVELPFPKITFKVRGSTAGKAYWQENRVDFNFGILARETETFLESTVPHEVAHLIARRINLSDSPHGTTWKQVMRTLGYPPERTHRFKTVSARNVQRHTYVCSYKEHKISSTIVNRIDNGRTYSCKDCGDKIRPRGAAKSLGARTFSTFIID